jgi:hypothetical protein
MTGPRLKKVLVAVFLGVLCPGCLYDENDRCASGYVYATALKACVCPPGAVAVAGGCKSCGVNEEAVGVECKCKSGTTLNPAGACEIVSAGAGAECAPAASTCTAPSPVCHASADGKGYCTSKGCTAHGDCAAGWTCTTWEAEPFCRRPYTGIGKTCAANPDCAGLDASYCESFSSKSCMVAGCTLSPDTCGVGLACCDLAKLGLPVTFCLPPASCPTAPTAPSASRNEP